jgi:hypothetical protein
MIENTEISTDSSVQPPESEKPKPSAEEQTALAIKAIEVQYKALVAGSRLHIRTLLNMLTSRGIDGNLQHQIKESIERAIVAALDYGVDIKGEAPVRTHGALGKLESALAMQMAKAKEHGMVIMSSKLEKALKEEQLKGETKNGEESKTDESQIETKTN